MQVRRGFHRIGMVGLVPLAALAICLLVFASYIWMTAQKQVLTGPDGAKIEFPALATPAEMEREHLRRYGIISFVYPTDGLNAREVIGGSLLAGIAALVSGGLWYLACWALGWVIAGFRSD